MQIVIDIPIPSSGQNIINIPIHYCGGQVVDAGGYGFDERKTGKWKPFDLTWGRSVYSCTACGEAMDIPTEMSKPIYRFCPNCGAKMEVDNAEL